MSRRWAIAPVLSLSGLDGAGKSTAIAVIEEELRRRGLQPRVITMYDDIGPYALVRRFRDRVRPPSAPADVHADQLEALHAAQAAAPLLPRTMLRILRSRAARVAVYPLDVLWVVARSLGAARRGEVLVSDRYLYDTLADIAEGDPTKVPATLLRLTPSPARAVLLDVDPEVAWQRKGEYPAWWGARRRQVYLEIFDRSAGTVIPSADLVPTRAAIAEVVQQALDA